jgi:hypothetical protein
VRQLLRRVRYFLRQRELDADLAEEIALHRSMSERAPAARGVDRGEARFAASRAFGNIALARDRARDVWQPRWLHGGAIRSWSCAMNDR